MLLPITGVKKPYLSGLIVFLLLLCWGVTGWGVHLLQQQQLLQKQQAGQLSYRQQQTEQAFEQALKQYRQQVAQHYRHPLQRFSQQFAALAPELQALARQQSEISAGQQARDTRIQAGLEQQLYSELQQRYQLQAEFIARVSQRPLWDRDLPLLTAYVKGLLQDPQLLAAVFYDADGQALTRYLPRDEPRLDPLLAGTVSGTDTDTSVSEQLAQIVTRAAKQPDYLLLEQPVSAEGVKIGRLLLLIDRQPVQQRIQTLLQTVAGADEERGPQNTDIAGSAAGLLPKQEQLELQLQQLIDMPLPVPEAVAPGVAGAAYPYEATAGGLTVSLLLSACAFVSLLLLVLLFGWQRHQRHLIRSSQQQTARAILAQLQRGLNEPVSGHHNPARKRSPGADRLAARAGKAATPLVRETEQMIKQLADLEQQLDSDSASGNGASGNSSALLQRRVHTLSTQLTRHQHQLDELLAQHERQYSELEHSHSYYRDQAHEAEHLQQQLLLINDQHSRLIRELEQQLQQL